MYMVANGMSPDIMNEIFQLRANTHYHVRHTLQSVAHPIHSVYNESEYALYLGPKIWELIPPEIKTIESLAGFQEKLKKWKTLIALVYSVKFSLLAISV